MDSLKISNTYAIYKAGQNKFTTWLARTAATCTGASNSAAGTKSKSKHASILPRSNVLISELQGLANTVAKRLPADEIPYNILNLLRDVIERRRESARFFTNQSEQAECPDSSLSIKNDGHLHMIKVLEGVLKVLEAKARTSLDDRKISTMTLRPSNREKTKIGNVFEKLELHQPSVEDHSDLEEELKELNVNSLQSRTGKGGKKISKPIAKRATFPSSEPLSNMEYELVSDEFDVPFLIHCFLQDINKIRDYLLERWCDYQDGLLSLTSISVTTNTAFDLFQRAERDLQIQLPKGTVLENFQNTIIASFATDPFEYLGEMSHVDKGSVSYPGWKNEMYEKADWACLTVYQQLKNFIDHLPPVLGNTPFIPPRVDTQNQDYKCKNKYGQTLESKLSRNVVVLNQFLAEMCAYKNWKQTNAMKIPIEDELQRGMMKALTSRNLPMWLVFACQIYVDIRYVLEENVDRAHHELTRAGIQTISILVRHEEFSPYHPEDIGKRIVDLKNEIAFWANQKDYLGMTSGSDVMKSYGFHAEPFFLLRRHPILCGLLVFRFNSERQDIALRVTNSWRATVAAAHIYNAVKHELQATDSPLRPWPDMDWLIVIHEARWMFIGDRPTNPKEYFRRYELAMGTSVGMFAAQNTHARNGGLGMARAPKGERALYWKAHASWILRKRFFGSDNATQMLSNFEKMFQTVYDKNGRSFDSGNSTLIDKVIQDDFDHRSTLVHRHFQKSQTLSPLQVIDMLCRTVDSEKLQLNFDYIHLHETSTLLLRELNESFKGPIKQLSKSLGTPPVVREDEGELPMIARFALGFLQAEDAKARADIVETMAAAMDEDIRDHGSDAAIAMQNVLTAGFPYGPNEPFTDPRLG